MSERERFATEREAVAAASRPPRMDGDRYQSALSRYLAAVAGAGAASESAAETTPGAATTKREQGDGAATKGAQSTASPAAHGASAAPETVPGVPVSDAPWSRATVRDVMTSDVIVIDENASFKHIATVLARHRVSAVPVVDRHQRVLGVVSESDLLAKVASGGDLHARMGSNYTERQQLRRKAQGETAGDVMTAPAITVSAAESVSVAARIAARAHVRRLPVVDERGAIVGIVSRSDLLRVFLKGDDELRDYIADDVIGRRFLLQPGAVAVDVVDGVVTLRGQVETKPMLGPLLDDIRSLAGVVAVHSELGYEAEYPVTSASLTYPPPTFRAP